ncbi:Protein NRT1/ PTR FAMILY 4.7 [Carex littledalei]|uniref:Protein NRT1/ PTR FAMILY 4.7 n=1 Tax=Carex littledalei TaxID=544730 RepID=A0A833R195_9POAL|nr:Protein NRT1/ PTR FAMILY 4.7 [Carex littledalei]
MKSIGTSIFYCILGVSAWLSGFLINVVNKVTRNGEGKGWLDGANLNKSHLDRFYWLLSVIGLLWFLNYAYWANKCVCRYNSGTVIEDVKRSPKRETDTI